MSRKFSTVSWAVLLANLAVIALLLNAVSIPLLSPVNGWAGTERQPELAWGGLQGGFVLMIDEDPGFGSPVTREVDGNSYSPQEPLEFGTYYWKVVSAEGASSATGMFTVVSEVEVERLGSQLRNTGNTDIMLEREMPGQDAGNIRLSGLLVGIGEAVEIGGTENVIAKQP